MALRIASGPPLQKGAHTKRGVKEKPFRSQAYMAWVASLPCCVTGCTVAKRDAHHVRLGLLQMGKRPPDNQTVPLLHTLHIDQYTGALHRVGEAKFWTVHGIDPKALATGLFNAWLKHSGVERDEVALEFMAMRKVVDKARRAG